MKKDSSHREKRSLRDLYPTFDAAWHEQAEENLKRYVAILIKISERLANEEALTNKPPGSTMEGKGRKKTKESEE